MLEHWNAGGESLGGGMSQQLQNLAPLCFCVERRNVKKINEKGFGVFWVNTPVYIGGM